MFETLDRISALVVNIGVLIYIRYGFY